MRQLEQHWLRLAGGASVMAWLVSLSLPAYVYAAEIVDGVENPDAILTSSGFECLLLGWLTLLLPLTNPYPGQELPALYGVALLPTLGPEGQWSFASLSWYANLIWAFGVARLLRGQRPYWSLTLLAILLALPALQTFWVDDGANHGLSSAQVPRVGAYVWAVCMSAPFVALSVAGAIRVGSNDQ